jgi:hypothetical protein
MMHQGSRFVCSSIPLKLVRASFLGGALSPPYRPSVLRLGAQRLRVTLGLADGIGDWYTPNTIRKLAAEGGLTADFYGCTSYLYRFNAVMHLD